MPNEVTASLILGDCLEKMKEIEKESVDLAIFSPPYNVGINYAKRGKKADELSTEEYRTFAKETMEGVYSLLKNGGRACVEIGGSGRDFPMTFIWQEMAYLHGFSLFSEIGMEHRKTNQCAWGSWLKADAVHTIPNFHMLYVFYKKTSRKTGGQTTIDKRDFVDWTRGYWRINWSLGATKDHPAQFPVELPTRCMRLFGHKGDVVLDPFMGSGTTGVACIENGRSFIGIEISEEYYTIAERRIKESQMQPNLFQERGV